MCLKLLGFIYAENLCCISGELVEREDKKPPEYWEGNPFVRFYAITFITFGVIVKCYC